MTGLAAVGKRVGVDELFKRMHEMGLVAVPLPNSTGSDDGLLYYRTFPEYIDTVAVWDEMYAVALRVPSQRDWSDPFKPSPAMYRCVGPLREVLSGLAALAPYAAAPGARHRNG